MADLAKTNKQGFGARAKKFLRETKAELKKVTWPTRDQLIHNTMIIISFIIIVTIILSVLDIAFAELFQFLTNLV